MEILKKDIKLVKSLQQKKFRKEYGLFAVEGRKMVEELLTTDYEVEFIFSTDPHWAHQHKAALVSAKEMEMLSSLASPSPFLAVAKMPQAKRWMAGQDKVLVLDGIADPGNLGTILRSCEWFGIQEVVLSPDCAELFNPKTVQATMGSLFRVSTFEESLPEMLSKASDNGYEIVGTMLSGHSLYRHTWKQRTVLVTGSESHGIRQEVVACLHQKITIPGKGNAESLNAAIATSIALVCWSEGLSKGSLPEA